VIQPRFDSADDFFEGLAFVQEDARYGWIDTQGKFVIAAPDGCDLASRFSEGLAAYRVGGRWGYIDRQGRVVVPAIYDKAEDFSEGLACVCVGAGRSNPGKFGFIDKKGLWVIKPQFVGASSFSEGVACVEIGKNCVVTGTAFINKRGIVVINLQHQKGGPYYEPQSFSGGVAAVNMLWLDPRSPDGLRRAGGFINKEGDFVLKAQWQDVSSFSEGFAVVQNQRGSTSFVDGTGKVVGKVRGVGSRFSEGLASVRVGHHWGYIDRQMKFVVHPDRQSNQRQGLLNEAMDFSGGLARVHIGGQRIGSWHGWFGGAWYYMNQEGKLVRRICRDDDE